MILPASGFARIAEREGSYVITASYWPARKACAAGFGSIEVTVTSFGERPFFFSIHAMTKYGEVPGAWDPIVLPFRSAIFCTLARVAMPSAPKLLSIWKICLVATPFAFQTSQVSAVVAAHWTSPEAMARWRLCCGIFLI